jgi:hypothetical protein
VGKYFSYELLIIKEKVVTYHATPRESQTKMLLEALDFQAKVATELSTLPFTDARLQKFLAISNLAQGMNQIDTQITAEEEKQKALLEKQLAEQEKEWAKHHPVQSWLKDVTAGCGDFWGDVKAVTEAMGDIPGLKTLSDELLVLEGFIGAAGNMISGTVTFCADTLQLLDTSVKSAAYYMMGEEPPQWMKDDLNGFKDGALKAFEYVVVAGMATNPGLDAIYSNEAFTESVPGLDWIGETYRKDKKVMVDGITNYVNGALTDPYKLGGAIFDVASVVVGPGMVTGALKGTSIVAKVDKFIKGTKVFKAIDGFADGSRIAGKLDDVVTKVKNIEIPGMGPVMVDAATGAKFAMGKRIGDIVDDIVSKTKGTSRSNELDDIFKVADRSYDPNKPLSPSNYPPLDPEDAIPPVKYEPESIEELKRMERGQGPRTKKTHGDRNIEPHHRNQKSVENGGVLDDLEEYTHRRGGNHARHDQPSELAPKQRAKEIREHYKKRANEYKIVDGKIVKKE